MEQKTIEDVIHERHRVSTEYCIKMGWPTDFEKLTFEQILEIRKLPEWINASLSNLKANNKQ